jgi:GntR family transcriptional regulator
MAQSPFRFRLDNASGVPVYRQLIDQVQDLAINPNTVMRAYRELEIRGVLDTQQGTGTFIAPQRPQIDDDGRARRLGQLIDEFVARAGSGGFTLAEILEALKERGK